MPAENQSAPKHELSQTSVSDDARIAKMCNLSVPERLTLRARLITRIVRLGVRLWPREDPLKFSRRARQFFELPNILGIICSRGMRIERVEEDGLRGEWIRAPGRKADTSVLLYLHGGGYVSCSARSHRSITATLARELPGSVFALDYRLAPEFPFPAAVDDAVACYEWLLGHGVVAEKIALAGDSAGGGLALALLLRCLRAGKPLPACTVCFSPWVDLTGEFDYANGGSSSGSIFKARDITSLASIYLQGASPQAPEASPLFADLSGLPPLLICAARTELLADDALRLHGRATDCGVKSTLLLYPDLPHVWQIYGGALPEARLALEQAAEFILAAWR